jgi:hypothetical protein
VKKGTLLNYYCKNCGLGIDVKRISIKLTASVILLSVVSVEAKASQLLTPYELNTSVGIKDGFAQFNIAGPYGNPNILSELTWDKLRFYQSSIDGEVRLQNGVVLAGGYAYGHMYDGRNQDSDYFLDNRQGEFSRSYADTFGSTRDFSASWGYRWLFAHSSDTVAALTLRQGFHTSKHDYGMKNGTLTIALLNEELLGDFPGLRSTYETNWKGPFLGIRMDVDLGGVWLKATYDYMRLNYKAKGRWNLRSDFMQPVSFMDRAKGSGHRATLMMGVEMANNWDATIEVAREVLNAKAGKSYTYHSNGETSVIPLNKSTWNSTAIKIGLTARF